MPLGDQLINMLQKSFPPKTRIDDIFRGNELTIVTNNEGEAVSLYIGKRLQDGRIKGEYYSRKIVKDSGGKIIKSHWDNKGKVG